LEYFKNNFTADYYGVFTRQISNIGNVAQGEHPKMGVGVGFSVENLQYSCKVTMTD